MGTNVDNELKNQVTYSGEWLAAVFNIKQGFF